MIRTSHTFPVIEAIRQDREEADMSDDPTNDEVFHQGEIAVQSRAGVRERVARGGGRMIRPFMPEQHRDFFTLLPTLFVASLDEGGQPWASVLAGPPGFVQSPDPQVLTVAARPLAGDPLGRHLKPGAALGLLGLQFHTRRRNRVNGRVAAIGSDGFALRVEQSFGNCPQYIQARAPLTLSLPEPGVIRREGRKIADQSCAVIRRADTFFIASAAPDSGADMSHRGGRPGFVAVSEENGQTVLTAPDFRGNNLFNTFGNIAADPRAGLLFADFASGDLLSLAGRAEIVWDGPELAAFAGAERLLRFSVEEGVMLNHALPLTWSDPQPAPQLAATGSWASA